MEKNGTCDTLNSELGMLRTITDKLPIGLCYVHLREFLWVNQFMLDLTGYTQGELLGTKTRRIYESDTEYERIEKLLTTAKAGVVTRVVKKDGSKVNVMIHAITDEYVGLSAKDFTKPLVKTFSVIPDDIATMLQKGCTA
jgi:PAS domain S-box-containing protein